jgi:hypothetical protein
MGQIDFPNVTPGDYKIFAWNGARRDDWFNPRFLESFEKDGKLIRVEPLGTTTEAIELISIKR